MGLEHLGVVVGDGFDEFSRVHRAVLTGQQFQSAAVDPVYVLFEDFTHVKFYRRSFFDVVEDAEGPFGASSTWTTGCRSGWSPPRARTRYRADIRPPRYSRTTTPPAARACGNDARGSCTAASVAAAASATGGEPD